MYGKNKHQLERTLTGSTPTAGLVRGGLIALLGLWALAGCGGGAGTEPTPGDGGGTVITDDTTPAYDGPDPLTEDTLNFKQTFFDNLRSRDRCGGCHSSDVDSAQTPLFVDWADVNNAYTAALSYVDRDNPANSAIIAKVVNSAGARGHNCWLSNKESCGVYIQNQIEDWVNASDGATTIVQLNAPPSADPTIPQTFTTTGFGTIEGYLRTYCNACHLTGLPNTVTPTFADPSPADRTYNLVVDNRLIDLSDAGNSRLVTQIRRGHAGGQECWVSSDCEASADTMQAAIQTYIDGLPAPDTTVFDALLKSGAVHLKEGTLATGGSRFEANMVAKYEFKEGSGSSTVDSESGGNALALLGTEGVDFEWVGGFGVGFISDNGRAQATTTDSEVLHRTIRADGTFSVEAWVVPANVTQEDANIISYSAGNNNRNYAVTQTLYNYEFYNRSDETGSDGAPRLQTPDADEVLQASLQHVVMTYTPVDGRKIYVNGRLRAASTDSLGSLASWNNSSYAFMLGNDLDGDHPWRGVVRMVALHNRALTEEQIAQNNDVGIGEKYLLPFEITDHLPTVSGARFYVVFEASVFDGYSYLFANPKFMMTGITAFPSELEGVVIDGIRIGVNGTEATEGQAFANLTATLSAASFDETTGQQDLLTSTSAATGTIIRAQRGEQPSIDASDEFFLSFERIASNTTGHDYVPAVDTALPAYVPATDIPDIGLRTFEEIHASMSKITGIPRSNSAVDGIYQTYRQQLPSTENLRTFVPAHQMAVTQLALTYCNELVNAEAGGTPSFFSGFDFSAAPGTAFATPTDRAVIIDPLLEAVLNVDTGNAANNLATEADETTTRDLLGSTSTIVPSYATSDPHDSLITFMVNNCPTGEDCSGAARTQRIVKATCGAVLSSGSLLIQ